VLLLVSPSLALLRRYDEACRGHGVAFFGAASRGAASFLFANLHTHTFASTVGLAAFAFLALRCCQHPASSMCFKGAACQLLQRLVDGGALQVLFQM